MSLRHIKKAKPSSKTVLETRESSGEEYEPLYARLEVNNAFAGIALTDSESSSKEESSDLDESYQPARNKKQERKKKKAKKIKKPRRLACAPADEVEQSVMAVNALLGSPSAAPTVSAEAMEVVKELPKDDIRSVDVRKLNVCNELKKMFGPDSEADRPRNRGRVPNLRRIHKQVIIEDGSAHSNPVGLSMILVQRREGRNFFKFRHNKVYRDFHIKFLKRTDHRFIDPTFSFFGETFKHVEAQLEIADFFLMKEEYTLANNLVEKVIFKMETVFHPLFRLADPNTRLEYKYIENRTFHVAMLKYIHLLSNRACHHTALELAKVLMNLDPTDPLAVIFIVDVLAIRAREFEWLIKAIDYWKVERSAGDMFNMKYSYAFAHFHLAYKNNGDMNKATQLLQDAILSFPKVALHIMELANVADAPLLATRKLFDLGPATTENSRRMRELFLLYAHLVQGRWREPESLQWLVATAKQTADMCESDEEMQARADLAIRRAASVLRAVPVQVLRHLCVIKPMSSLLVDGAVPIVPITRFSDPLPDVSETVDHPGYMQYSTHYTVDPQRPFINVASLPIFLQNSIFTGLFGPLEDYPSSLFEDSDDDSVYFE